MESFRVIIVSPKCFELWIDGGGSQSSLAGSYPHPSGHGSVRFVLSAITVRTSRPLWTDNKVSLPPGSMQHR